MALLTTQAVARAGLEPTYATAESGGDTVRVVANLFLHCKNGDDASHTVTVATPGTVSGLAIEDLAVAVPAGEERMIGPISQVFAASTGLASITYDAVTDLTIAAIRI